MDPGLEGVAVTESNAVEVQLTENAQVITYTVTDMDGLEAKAFVRVPGDQLRPHIKPGLDPLKAFSGEPLTIDLADYVVVREGHKPRITVEESVKALEGKVEITDKDTLVYTSAEDYAGAASVSMYSMRSAGWSASTGRYAAPDFSTATCATIMSIDLGIASATTCSGPAPCAVSRCASRFALASSSP